MSGSTEQVNANVNNMTTTSINYIKTKTFIYQHHVSIVYLLGAVCSLELSSFNDWYIFIARALLSTNGPFRRSNIVIHVTGAPSSLPFMSSHF